MEGLKAELLRGLWYVALPGEELRPGRMLAKTLLGEPVLFGRARDGGVFALRDTCPHRGIPLRYGAFDGETIACSYHGWRFGRDGTCVEIPSLREGQKVDLAKIRCPSYPASSGRASSGSIFRATARRPRATRPSRRACRSSPTTRRRA